MRIGVLALQGGVAAHQRALEELGHHAVPVRAPSDLDGLDGLVLPGGESTAQWRQIDRLDLERPLDEFVRGGGRVLATCAGLILAARRVTHPEQRSFGWLDVTVARNGWGRQIESFEACDDQCELPLVFIRAPRIVAVGGGARVLATLDGEPILVRQGRVTGATFHPELTAVRAVHAAAFAADPA